MCTFSEFQNGIGGATVQNLMGLDISTVRTWQEFREVALHNRKSFGGPLDGAEAFVERIRKVWRGCSTGERTVLLGILFAMDYRALADELATEACRTFLDFAESTTGEHLNAAASCIMQRD